MESFPIRVLYVEDDQLDRMAFERFVKTNKLSYQYDLADSVFSAKVLLAANKYDILISDYHLGDGTAFDLFEFIGEPMSVATILLTGLGDEQIAAKAIKLGAHEYLIKDTNGRYLELIPNAVMQAVQEKVVSLKLSEYHLEIEKLVSIRTQELSKEIEERKRVEEELSQMNLELEDRVNKRTEMLNRSLISLNATQDQLIYSEKTIATNQLLNNLSQEINTPVGVNITLSTFLIKECDLLFKQYQEGVMTKDDFEEFIKAIQTTMAVIYKNLVISADLVKKFKYFNKKKLLEEVDEIALSGMIQNVTELLSTKLSSGNITVKNNIPTELVLRNYPSIIRHILFNLLMHTIVNTMTESDKCASFSGRIIDSQLELIYCDALPPISEIELIPVFDTFYILNFGEHARFSELNTVYTLIQEIERGSLRYENNLLEGNAFIITIPSSLKAFDSNDETDVLMHP